MTTAPNAHGSIRRRLLVLLLIGAAGLAVLLYFVVQSVSRQIAQESQDNILAASAISILDSAAVHNGQITIDLPYSAFSMLDSVTDERVFYAIRLGDEFLSGYQDLPQMAGNAPDRRFFSATYLGEDIRIASAQRPISLDTGSARLRVSVAQTLDGQRQTLLRISRISMAVGAGFFMLTAILAMLVARSTTQPLKRLAASVARRGPKDLRPVTAPVPQEMVPLVSGLNSFMQRLKHSLSRSEDFIAEAAHRVRTPLAIVRTQAEITLRRVDKPENREAIREMIRAIDESSRTAGQLLDHAMVTFRTDHLATEAIDMAALVQDTVERLRPLSEMRDITLQVQSEPGLQVSGDPILIQNALRNVLDNAIKYSQPDDTVLVTLNRTADQIDLTVRDTGAGFPEAPENALANRFQRGSNVAGIVGSGLGLTIVNEVMQAHGGTLTYGNSTGGGACVTLSFPWS